MFKKINHIAIAVKDLDQAATFYQNTLGLPLSGVEVVAEQKTKVGFFQDRRIEYRTRSTCGARLSFGQVLRDSRAGDPSHLSRSG